MTTTYTYDANGLRQSKTTNGVTTSHIYDGQNIVMDSKSGEKQIFHRGISLISRTVNGGSKEYYTFNTHGDTTALVNASGTILKDYTYDAFGNQKQEQSEDNNPFRYCGEYFDSETGFIYLRARYYDSSIGRFTTEDAHWNPSNMIYGDNSNNIISIISILQALNKYLYCINNPMSFKDSTGMNIEEDYYILSPQDKSIMRAISKLWTLYDLQGFTSLKDAMHVKAVALRQKDQYKFSYFNSNPVTGLYIDNDYEYSGLPSSYVNITIMSEGFAYFLGGENKKNDKLMDVYMLVVPNGDDYLDFAKGVAALDKFERLKKTLKEGDIQIETISWVNGQRRRELAYFRADGTYIFSEIILGEERIV